MVKNQEGLTMIKPDGDGETSHGSNQMSIPLKMEDCEWLGNFYALQIHD